MALTILYLNPCRRERLRGAFAHTIQILGGERTARLVNALQNTYEPLISLRTNYNLALYLLQHVVGIEGLAAISILKEAWHEGCLQPTASADGPHNITHMPTNVLQ